MRKPKQASESYSDIICMLEFLNLKCKMTTSNMLAASMEKIDSKTH